MRIEEFRKDFVARVAAAAPGERLGTAAREIGAFFGVEPHEVAFFDVDFRQHRIVFRWPPSLASTGHIPLKGVNSLVAKTANEGSPFMDNAFATSRHLFMFEHLLTDREERIPVQKVMSVPIMHGAAVRGVVQVGRKGATPQEAGADFTTGDLEALREIAAAVAECGI